MRQTRRQYRERLPLHRRKIGFDEALAKVKREVKRRLIADGRILDPAEQPPKHQWRWAQFWSGKNGIVAANTRSEARSRIKAELGIRNHRLPTDVQIILVEGSMAS